MIYKQNVILKKTDFDKVVKSFHSIKIVKFLTRFQPVKIINWSGIQNNDKAYFKLWFFGWKNFRVIHKDYKLKKDRLSFIDKGEELPFGIIFWEHRHTVEKIEKGTLISDVVNFKHSNKYLEYLLFPILMFPIIIRKFLYKIYFIS
tara:strand:+ start:351 stop:788 length:438 start_codon:yes stop_codon:yes gene_type:complete